MLSIKKSLIVLGALGAAILGNPAPSMAHWASVKTPAAEFGASAAWRSRASGAHAFAPRFDTRGMWNSRQSKGWDAYGLRWDGGN